MRVALIGYGAVAEIHAARLKRLPEVSLSAVYGPDLNKGRRFAERHEIELATANLPEALAASDAAVIASPTPKHFEHAMQATVPTLVELPPCSSGDEARQIEAHFDVRGVPIRCAHTSRYLTPYRRIGEWIRSGALGEIRQVIYYRHLTPRHRSWSDHALLHHGAHPLDLMLDWFGEFTPAASAAPAGGEARSITLLGRLPHGAPATLAISYDSAMTASRLIVVGGKHTIATDGFSSIESDSPQFAFRGDGQEIYEQAIQDQDADFLRVCRGDSGGVLWRDTVRLMDSLDTFTSLLPGR